MIVRCRSLSVWALLAGMFCSASPLLAQGTGGGGGGTGGGGGGTGGGGSGGNRGGQDAGSTQSGSIDTSSLLGSFDNIGRGGRGGALATSNLFAPYYVNPYAQGLVTQSGQNFTSISTSGFGQPVFNTTTTGGTSNRSTFGSTQAGRTGGGTGGMTGGRTGSGTSFGGTSTGGGTNFGSTSGVGGFVGGGGGANTFGGSNTGLGGSASLRSGSTTGTTFGGGSFGPTIGRTGPVVGSVLGFSVPARLEAARPSEIQSIISRSNAIAAPVGVNALHNAGTVILRGTVASLDERRIVENMVRLHPGVREVRNELEVR